MVVETQIGTYGAGDPVPEGHLLDLKLQVPVGQVLIEQDGMAQVFDYDPLMADIRALAAKGHRDTQEWLVSQIARLCAQHGDILACDIFLRKYPAHGPGGTLGVRLSLDPDSFAQLRKTG